MGTLSSLWGLLLAVAGAWSAYQALQKRQQSTETNAVDTEADQAAAEAVNAKTLEEAFDASKKIQDASSRS